MFGLSEVGVRVKNPHFRYKDWSNGDFENTNVENTNGNFGEKVTLRNEVHEFLSELDESVVLMDGFDDAIIGFAERINTPLLAIYDWDKMVDILMTRDGMEYEEAVEYIAYNCMGAWVGDGTPMIMLHPFRHREA